MLPFSFCVDEHPELRAFTSNGLGRREPLRRIVLARTIDEILALQSRWEYLQARSPATVFQSFHWNSTAARIFDHEEPHIIFCETEGGMALLPLCIDRVRNVVACLGDVLFDYRDALTIGEPDALLAAWQEATSFDLPFSSGGLLESSRSRWAGFHLSSFYGRPVVRTADGRAGLFSKNHARSASRLRRLERMGVTLREYTPAEPDLLRWIYEQKAAQPPESGANVFRDPRRIEFMIAVAKADPHRVELSTLEFEGRCIAALVTLRERHWRRFYTIWFAQEWATHSPGIGLIYEITRRSLEQDLNCDYMTGEQGYKMRFATAVEPMYWVDASSDQLRSLSESRKIVAA